MTQNADRPLSREELEVAVAPVLARLDTLEAAVFPDRGPGPSPLTARLEQMENQLRSLEAGYKTLAADFTEEKDKIHRLIILRGGEML